MIEDDAFIGLTHLKTLTMSYNLISILGRYTFRGLKYLTFIDLRYNHLMMLDFEIFPTVPELNISLSKNHLKCRTFHGKLLTFSMGRCNISVSRIPTRFLKYPHLCFLSIKYDNHGCTTVLDTTPVTTAGMPNETTDQKEKVTVVLKCRIIILRSQKLTYDAVSNRTRWARPGHGTLVI